MQDTINQSYTEHQRPYEPIAKTLEAEKENSDPRGQHFSTIDSKEIQVHPAQKALVESDLSTVPSSDYAPVTVESAVHDTMTLPAVDVPEIGTKLIGNADVHVARPIGLEQRCYSTTCKESQRCYSFVCLRQVSTSVDLKSFTPESYYFCRMQESKTPLLAATRLPARKANPATRMPALVK